MSYRNDNLVCLRPVPSDIAIAQSVKPLNIATLAEKMGIPSDFTIPYGHTKAKIDLAILDTFKEIRNGKMVCVSGITPTPFGEGKTTTTLGLSQALGKVLGKKVVTCLRQPSMGPTFGIKGGAAGGGYSQVIPMEEFNLHLTGDIHAVSLAHNLMAAALDARIFHEATQSDKALFSRLVPADGTTGKRVFSDSMKRRLRKLGIESDDPESLTESDISRFVRLDIDPNRVEINRVLDINDRFLRSVTVGLGPNEKMPRETAFDISVSSEVMAILALANDLNDMNERLRRIIVAYNKKGKPVTTDDLGVAGAMTVLLKEAINPTLLQSLEGTPVLVHAGPFANIAHGNSSIIADKIGLKLVGDEGFVVTEAGFGSDVGFEKFCNIKCRSSNIFPDCVVLVATIRALKLHGGAPNVTAGRPVDNIYKEKNIELVKKGCDNLQAHIQLALKFGIPVVVCVNHITGDDDEEVEIVCSMAKAAGAFDSVVSTNWADGGAGARLLANTVIKACSAPSGFTFLYPLSLKLTEKFEILSRKIYGADGVRYSDTAAKQLEELELLGMGGLPVCVAKTQYSLSHDPSLKGRPSNFVLPIEKLKIAAGAGFVFAYCGSIMTMPGLPTRPAYFDVDIDSTNGKIIGLF